MTCASYNRGLVAVVFFMLGIGILLPWNFFITAFDYFNERLNTTLSSVSESDQKDPYMFNNMCVLLSKLPLLLFTLLNSFVYQHIPEKMRIAGSMGLILGLFILTAALVKVRMEPDLFFYITMATIWFINMFVAVLQGSLFGLVGKFPSKYISWFMSGQAMAGIFSAVAMLITQIFKTDNESAALGYFITPCIATVLTLCCYLMLPHLRFSRMYLEDGTRNKKIQPHLQQKQNVDNVTLDEVKPTDSEDTPAGTSKSTLAETDAEAFNTADRVDQPEQKATVLAVFKKIWMMALCVTCVFGVTLSVFPAITVLVKPNHLFTGIWAEIFTPVCCFIVFNVMDWIGRSITSIFEWPRKQSRLFPILVAARMIFIPAFMLCNIPSRTYLPSVFKHEFAYIVIMSLFALTNGYFGCLSISYAPQLVRPKDAETAGALMTFFLALGLSLGGVLSFALIELL